MMDRLGCLRELAAVTAEMLTAAQERDAEILKHELHVNIVRTSHYPQSTYFLDRCDEIGLLGQHLGDMRNALQQQFDAQHALIERDTRAWLERAVIGLNLCPFAKAVPPTGRHETVIEFSDDGGASWRAGMVGIHEDYHAMWIDPNDPEHFVVGGDAGIFQTWDKGGTYDAVNNMAMGQFYGISYDFQVPYRVCGGLQDNGSSCGLSRRAGAPLQMTDWFAIFAADGLQTAQDPFNPDYVYYESQGGNISRRNVATGEVMSVKARTVTRTQFGQQIARIRGAGAAPLTLEQTKSIADIRVQMKKELADPNVATRWNWNTPFILSRHDANVLYSGAEKLFKSVKKGEEPYAISPDLSSRDEARIRITTGYDIDGNPALDATGAGDCFCATFVTLMAAGQSLPDALARANAAGALAVTRLGPMEGNAGLPAIDALCRGQK